MKRLLATAIVLSGQAVAIALSATAPAAQYPHPAVVRVMAAERGGTSYGSGALVAVNRTHGLVVTNWHVVRDAAGGILIAFPDGFRCRAVLLGTDRDWDLAALAVPRPRVQPIPLAGEAPRPGEVLTIAGYGSGWYRASAGRCIQYVSPGRNQPFEMVELSTQARLGDSGGPILNGRGELAGVLFGAALGRTTGSYCGRVRRFLSGVGDRFQRLPSGSTVTGSTMIAQRPTPPPQQQQQPQPAPLVALGATSSSASSAPSSGPAYQDRPPVRELAELPMPTPQPTEAPTVTLVAPADEEPIAAVEPVGTGRFEQIKTVLAVIGIFAILFHGLRLLAAPQRS